MPKRSTLSKNERIYLRSEINQLIASRGSFVCYPFRVIYKEVPRQEVPLKLLVSVPKKRLKRAVDRNRIKRLTREAYRLRKPQLQELLPTDTTLLIGFIYLKERLSQYRTIERAMDGVVTKIQSLWSADHDKEGDKSTL